MQVASEIKASKCAECRHLEVRRTVYLCNGRHKAHRAFFTYGRPISMGPPLVQRCKDYEHDPAKA